MAQMKYFYELTISSSPHVHTHVTTQTIMRDVLIALTPALVGSVWFFGFRALMVTLVSAASAVFFEWAWCKLMKKNCKVYDFSACVTGALLAFTMSLDDFVISYFTSSDMYPNLSRIVYSSTKLGVKPTMYALSTLMFVTILLLLVLINRRTKLEEL